MPSIVEVPRIDRVSKGSKYMNEEKVKEGSALLLANQGTAWVGEWIEPVDTLVKARIASRIIKDALADLLDKPVGQFKIRVYTLDKDKWTFAVALQNEPEPETAATEKEGK